MRQLVQYKNLLESVKFDGSEKSVDEIKGIKGIECVSLEVLHRFDRIDLTIYSKISFNYYGHNVEVNKDKWVVFDQKNKDVSTYTGSEYLETFVKISSIFRWGVDPMPSKVATYKILITGSDLSDEGKLLYQSKDMAVLGALELRKILGADVGIKIFISSENDYEVFY
jgi:hypothetical protein